MYASLYVVQMKYYYCKELANKTYMYGKEEQRGRMTKGYTSEDLKKTQWKCGNY
jgi:hypothetical protein